MVAINIPTIFDRKAVVEIMAFVYYIELNNWPQILALL